jgi:hypothetical protein
MSINPLVCPDAGLAASQDSVTIELSFVGASLAANGSILALVPAQASAGARVHLAVGNGNNSTAQPSAAAVQALIKRPNGGSLSAQEQLIATGVKAALDQIEALADGADAVAFALGGLSVSEVIAAELSITSGAVQDTLTLVQAGPAQRIPEPVALSGSELVTADGTAFDLDADKIAIVGGLEPGSCSTVVGCIKVPVAAKLALAAGVTVKLKLHVKH